MPPVFYGHMLQCSSKLPKTRKLNVRTYWTIQRIFKCHNSENKLNNLVLLQTFQGTGRDWHADRY